MANWKKILLLVLFPTILWSSFLFTHKAAATDLGGSYAQLSAYFSKEWGLDPAARVIARSVFRSLTNQIIERVQGGGRNGGPAFVQNWRNFQLEAEYRGEDVFRAILANTSLCDYFEDDVKDIFGATNRIRILDNIRTGTFDSFQARTGCTLPSGFSLDRYKEDFAGNGGWQAWTRLLEPQNNFYGVFFESIDEAQRQRSIEVTADLNEAVSGGGYTSVRDVCQDEAVEGPGLPSRARCTFLGQVFTPGDLLGQSTAATIDNELSWLTTSDELSEVIVGIVGALINRLTNLSTAGPVTGSVANDGSRDYLACVESCQFSHTTTNGIDYCVAQCSGATVSNPGDDSNGGHCATCACRDIRNDENFNPDNYAPDDPRIRPDYAGDLQGAIDNIFAADPAFASRPNHAQNRQLFLEHLVAEIQNLGFNGTKDILNGNDIPGSAIDLIGIWRSGDSTMERYDALAGGGASLGDAAQTEYTGDIPLSCTIGGNPQPPDLPPGPPPPAPDPDEDDGPPGGPPNP